jgi:hypothetical protein
MATGAGADYLRMIDCRGGNRPPACGKRLMAGAAHITAVNVAGVFSARRNSVMAIDAFVLCKG